MAPQAGADEPLILTLEMDDRSQEWFDHLRKLHFPPERNYLSAHLTMFHKLPGKREVEISADLQEVCQSREPLIMTATGLRSLGRGVAYELSSPELAALRRELAGRWEPWLGAQDRRGFKPHVTVQNKVSPERARALREQLLTTFSPFKVGGVGLLLWRYLGGPWEPVGTFPLE
ncbi:MAG: 2'-5' RNA ligase family protein [Actinomycetota bacterium]|nr:2'-5' RNA ligase family protein [Actinomycetota bacterium]